MSVDQIISGVSIAILSALLVFAYTQILELNDRVLSLEKDKEHLLPQFTARIVDLQSEINQCECK